MTIQSYAQVKPCIAPGSHQFKASYPPAGTFGPVTVVCARCGRTPEQVTS